MIKQGDGIDSNHRPPPIAPDPQRARVPLPPIAEAGARLALGWLRNQYGLRDSRPLGQFALRSARFLALSGRQPLVETQLGDLSVLVSTADKTIARSVYSSGDWDPLLVGTVFRALDELGVAYRGTTFMEVGANFGVYALPAVARYGFARAIAYEPDPSAYELLAANIARNGLADRITAHNAALSSAPGELTLALGTSNAGDNRIIEGTDAADDRTTVRVPAYTFDGEVEAGNIDPAALGLVWLDVQGHEHEVLRGASALLDSGAALVMEYCTWMLDPEARSSLDELIAERYDVLVDLGWCALTNRIRFQPASAIRGLAGDGRALETDLLLLHRR